MSYLDRAMELQRIYNAIQSQCLETVQVELPVRARWKRAFRWPLTVLEYRRCGVSWRMAFRLTHWSTWYVVKPKSPRASP